VSARSWRGVPFKRNNWLFGCRRISPLRGQRPPNVRECRGRGKGTGSRAEGPGGKRDRDGRRGRGGEVREGRQTGPIGAGRKRIDERTGKVHTYTHETYAAPMAAASPPPFVTSRVQSSFGTGPAASLPQTRRFIGATAYAVAADSQTNPGKCRSQPLAFALDRRRFKRAGA